MDTQSDRYFGSVRTMAASFVFIKMIEDIIAAMTLDVGPVHACNRQVTLSPTVVLYHPISIKMDL